MRKKMLLKIIIAFIILIPNMVKAASISADVNKFNTQYNAMLNSTNVKKVLDCKFEDKKASEIDMKNNGIYQSNTKGTVTANAESYTQKVASNHRLCRHDYYQYMTEEDNLGEATIKRTVSADYHLIQSGILDINMDRGPIHSGGKFNFEISYVNTVRYYVENPTTSCSKGSNKVKVFEPVYECADEECTQEVQATTEITVCKNKAGIDNIYDLSECPGSNNKTTIEIPSCEIKQKSYSYTCEELPEEEAIELAEKAVKGKINNIGNSNATVTFPSESNVVTSKTTKAGKWVCEPIKKLVLENGKLIEVSAAQTLDSENEWVSRCNYVLDANLNLQSADVDYDIAVKNTNVFKRNENSYYIPLKYPSTDENNKYTVKATLTNLSGVNSIKWSADYTCAIDVKQLMYDLENGGFLFFYRPIVLTNPFPNREPSKNWITWWENASNQEKLASTYNNLEYLINLSPNDMNTIKDYNENRISNSGTNLGYLDYSINKNGTSNFSYVQSGRRTNDYSELGEFEGEDK